MKKLAVLTVFVALVASCADDNPPKAVTNDGLVSPDLQMDIVTANGQSPLTGILTSMPCNTGPSIYFGHYVNRKLTPLYGYYRVKDGTFYHEAVNRELSLPAGTYNMIYWGTSQV